MPRKSPRTRGKASRHGATQPETERENKPLLLRLPPDVILHLRTLAAERETTVSGLVADLVERANRR